MAASTATAGGLSKPYVQAGTFGVESNAKSAAEKIRRNGMNADVFELKGEDKSVWRVLVGPVATRSERRALLNDVKDLGFTDAFTAKN
nr:SPOR domain-containing protein [Ruegeria conchae]